MSRVLITGAAGFIGSHLTERLLADGHTVDGVDNFLTGRIENYPAEDEAPAGADRARLFEIDILNRAHLYELANLLRPELVIHCAASYSDPNLWHRDTDTNVAGTINAINVARHHGARLVYFQTALPPISSYAITKIAGEQYIQISGVPHLIFRLANIYGPRNLSGPIPTFYKRLTAGEPCTVTDTSRDMVYIDDLVRLVMRGIDQNLTGKYDICSGIQRPVRELYDAVARSLAIGAEPREVAAAPDDVKQMELNPTRALTELDNRVFTPLHEGVGAAVAWYREYGVGETFTHLALKG